MNQKLMIFAGAFLLLVGLAGAPVMASSYVHDNFTSGTLNNPPDGWGVTPGVVVSNPLPASPSSGGKAVVMSFSTGLTNSPDPSIPDNSGQIWTDFYTRPVKLNIGAPVVDLTATAQVFVNSNGQWGTISGVGNGATYQTNAWTNVLAEGASYPLVIDTTNWFHVSIMHDYVNKKWSLFVDDVPLATNLGFIAGSVASITNFNWFLARNLGGTESNLVWLDDFIVTNKVPVDALASPDAVGSTNGLSPAVALYHYGVLTMPVPAETNAVAVGETGVALQFHNIEPGVTYLVQGTTDPLGNNWASNGVLQGSVFSNANLLAGSTNRIFMRVSAVSRADGSTPIASPETYAAYKQYRSPSSSFIVGVPVSYGNASDRTMGGKMGTQLKTGLLTDDYITLISNNVSCVYTLNALRHWTSGDDPLLTTQWAPGVGMVVHCGSSGSASSTVFVGLKETNAVQIAVKGNNWAYLAWPHNDVTFSSSGGTLGFNAGTGDYIYIQTNGAMNYIPARYTAAGTWRRGTTGTGAPLSLTLQAGDGIIYRSLNGDKAFSSTGP